MILVFACLIPGNPSAAIGAAVGLFTYIASFGATWLPLPCMAYRLIKHCKYANTFTKGLYPAEISPVKTRGKANAVSTCSNWLFNFLIVMVTPIMVANIGWGTYLFFAAVNACFLPVIWFFYPETKQRSLEEIDIIFAKGYVEGGNYVKAARELPLLKDWEVETEAIRYGLIEEGEGEGRKRSLAVKTMEAGSEEQGR